VLNPTAFWFLRHGETLWNAEGLSQGRTDVPLNAVGIAQAHRAAGLLCGRGIERIVSSTLSRAMDTARIAATALALPFDTDPELQEASFGAEEGQVMGDWYEDWVAGTYLPAGAEPFADLRRRVRTVINRITAAPGLALIVAHGSMFRAARAEMGLSALVRTPNGVPLFCAPGAPWQLLPASAEDRAVL
jgi:probable phosphoglycerate mutase